MSTTFTTERINSLLHGKPAFPRSKRPWKAAILSSALLSILFVIAYGGSNALAAQHELRSCFFQWEKQIPFEPLLIVPYLSIDLFFVASFLLCADVPELRTHARRVALAILIAGVAFVLFPLTVGYARPEVSGWTGWLFEFLWSFDRPHNLVPSLHVALASLLWPVYARHTRGPLLWLVHGWFALIVVSPLLTWQHHILDVVTGALLGQFCIYCVPTLFGHDGTQFKTNATLGLDRSRITDSFSAVSSAKSSDRSLFSSTSNVRIARRCAMSSTALCVLALAAGSWAWLLLWPALSLAIISIAYIKGDGSVFRKSEGRIPISSRVILGPYLFGMFVRRMVYKNPCLPWREIAPGLYCGRLPTRTDVIGLRALGIIAVLDMTAEHSEIRAFRNTNHSQSVTQVFQTNSSIGNAIEYLNIPVLDLTEPSRGQLEVAVAFIAQQCSRGSVYVHCALGISRSVSAVSAYRAMGSLKN
jgi:membrane-associated phospholipid phosphatase